MTRIEIDSGCREMLLQWTSLEQAGPHVYWGGQPGNYCCNASSVPQTYTRDEMCGPPASAIGWSEPGLLHQALMQGLEPSTRYYFIVGDTVRTFSLVCDQQTQLKSSQEGKL